MITTDHAEEFNDNHTNTWGHGSNYTRYQTEVPFILYLPDQTHRVIDLATSHIDIPPTLLENYFGCTTDISSYSNGYNLLKQIPEVRPFVIGSYFNHAFIIEDNVYEIFPMYTRKYKLNNIDSKADPLSGKTLKKIMEEINRFYQVKKIDDDQALDFVKAAHK